jgi:hypothetical protein
MNLSSNSSERRDNMDCRKFQDIMSFYIDDQLDNIEKKEFELHLLTCEKCRKEYEDMLTILNEIKGEEVELPENFQVSLRHKLEKVSHKKGKGFNFKKFSLAVAGIIILLISYALIPKTMNLKQDFVAEDSQEGEAYYQEARSEDKEISESYDLTAGSNSVGFDKNSLGTVTPAEQKKEVEVTENSIKIIKEAYLVIDIEDYDRTFNEIVSFVQLNKGYIENASTTYYSNLKGSEYEERLKHGNIRIRIPQDKFDVVLSELRNKGVIKNENFSERNITEQYYDVENKVKNLKIQEERLREILKEAKNVDEILRVENELRRIRTEIDSNTTVIKAWDSMVNMSIVNVSLREVKRLDKNIKPVDNSIWTRAKKGFITTVNNIIQTVENVIVFIITVLPVLFIVAIALLILYIIVKRLNVKRK